MGWTMLRRLHRKWTAAADVSEGQIAAVIWCATYVLPFVAVYLREFLLPLSAGTARCGGGGRDGGRILGFEWLRFLIVLGGIISAFGMFNALVMSYSRLPLAMARDGMLPKVFAN